MRLRRFTELDLRDMMDRAIGCKRSREIGRSVVYTAHDKEIWQVVVEPDADRKILVVITANPEK